MNTIVVLAINRPLEDRSWFCHRKGEADRLAQWLSENQVDAVAIDTEKWDEWKNA